MAEHPIQSLFTTTMDSIQHMIDVNTVIGDPVETADGMLIIPVSRVSFGFAVGGGNIGISGDGKDSGKSGDSGFGGGSGAGVTVQPVAFLIIDDGEIHLLPLDEDNPYLKLLHVLPDLAHELRSIVSGDGGDDERSSVKA